MKRIKINLSGIVQGVGLRPHIWNLAKKYNLCGFILNNSRGVNLEIEGKSKPIENFLKEFKNLKLPLVKIEDIHYREVKPLNEKRFVIKNSSIKTKNDFTLISPDIPTCPDCLKELFLLKDRRCKYPFINCINCGPRFTIICDIPYDRKNTTMRDFKMCPLCQKEYDNFLDRRFHAQPNACSKCGPEIKLIDKKQKIIKNSKDIIKKTIELILKGKIIAIKSLGGYHLACDALNKTALQNLRQRKFRQDKPFALMVDSISTIRRFCKVSGEEEKLLLSRACPIVILKKKTNCIIPELVAPAQNYLGFILAYNPLQHLIFKELRKAGQRNPVLVMTSGNFYDEPIVYLDQDAKKQLSKIADYFLLNNRPIHMRSDDSLARIFHKKIYMLRRSRGYVPSPIFVKKQFKNQILSCGVELKNTFCLARDNYAFLSQHIGDLKNLETLDFFTKTILHFRELFNVNPEVIAYDLHPDYLSTKYALEQKNKKLIAVQHHHAHIVSCMLENKLEEKVIGISFDGTGYGDDGQFWGGEFFVSDYQNYQRVAHLKYIPLLGQEQAIKEPWRLTAVWLNQIFGDEFINLDIDFVKNLDKRKWQILKNLLSKNNLALTSSMGRLFDAVSSLLSIRDTINYEAQAAIELEMIIKNLIKVNQSYAYKIIEKEGKFIIEPEQIFIGIIEDLKNKKTKHFISQKFHETIAVMTRDTCQKIKDKFGLNKVVLSGGVFQNMVLLELTYNILKRNNFEVFIHHQVPCNDAGISLGQAIIANERLT